MPQCHVAVRLESSGSPDARLLQRIVARDGTAIRDLYDRYSHLLFSVIMRILRNRADAEDVLQEVFVRVWTRAERYDEGLGAPAPWLVRLARNRAIDRLRALRVRGVVDVQPAAAAAEWRPPQAADPDTPELIALDTEKRETVRHALAVLPAEQRTLIEAAFFEGYTHSELAQRLGLPLGTVKARIRAGMMAMRQWLEHAV